MSNPTFKVGEMSYHACQRLNSEVYRSESGA
jgi:hypothetical protein